MTISGTLFCISSIVRQFLSSPKTLSFGAAVFLVLGALTAKSLVIQRIAHGGQGVLGGPIALAAPQIDIEQASLDMAPQAPPSAKAPELSTGSLDGAGSLAQENKASEEEATESPIAEKNKAVIKEAKTVAKEAPKAAKPKSSRYFIQPASGINWGERHGNNAVDIGNSCGTPVLAAAAGTVIKDPGLGSGASGNNGGYGKFVYLKHSNGTKTRYAHLSKIYVTVGEQVAQGQKIAAIGNTGRVRGTTGCHLHFEVIGGVNPFIKH